MDLMIMCGPSRTVWTAAIVIGGILLAGLGFKLVATAPQRASAFQGRVRFLLWAAAFLQMLWLFVSLLGMVHPIACGPRDAIIAAFANVAINAAGVIAWGRLVR